MICDPCESIRLAKDIAEDFKIPDHILRSEGWIAIDTPQKRYSRKKVIDKLATEIIPSLLSSSNRNVIDSGEILRDWLKKCDAGDVGACNTAVTLLKNFLHRDEETRKAISCKASDDVFDIMNDLEPLVSLNEFDELDSIIAGKRDKWCNNPGHNPGSPTEEKKPTMKDLMTGRTLNSYIEAGKVKPLVEDEKENNPGHVWTSAEYTKFREDHGIKENPGECETCRVIAQTLQPGPSLEEMLFVGALIAVPVGIAAYSLVNLFLGGSQH